MKLGRESCQKILGSHLTCEAVFNHVDIYDASILLSLEDSVTKGSLHRSYLSEAGIKPLNHWFLVLAGERLSPGEGS